ncbi:MAG TPA: amidohydrolase family protein [Candidatus Saccharimonadales bacterium]|nr:amidohydrolase family protein [Candidatus Saccharimonadales bacterium]
MIRETWPAKNKNLDLRAKGQSHSRRNVLRMLSAAGMGLALPPRVFSQEPGSKAGIVDTHHHIYPPKHTANNLKRIVDDAPAVPSSLYTNWTPHYSLDQMDQNGVSTAIASISSPGVWFGNNEEGRRNARSVNEYGAQLGKDFPGRFGMWGAIPLPDIDGSLREIEYIFDVLKLDGIGLLSSYENGKLLGNVKYAPVMDELNRRNAVVFVHPTVTCCGDPIPRVNITSIEFPTDTTRTITDLVYSGTLIRCPNIRFIFSHGGGTILMLLARLSGGALTPEERNATIPNGFEHELKKLYYDIASVAVSPTAMTALFNVIPKDRILFGSDIPFWTIEKIATAMNKFDISTTDLRMIQRENALRLVPRFKS